MDVLTFQFEQFKKLLAGQSLAVPDLSVFLSLVIVEGIVASQIAIPVAVWGVEKMKEAGWIPR